MPERMSTILSKILGTYIALLFYEGVAGRLAEHCNKRRSFKTEDHVMIFIFKTFFYMHMISVISLIMFFFYYYFTLYECTF